jgi:2-polyprenyl-6-methoxyphenol hydroxylase-like FAD-dependent oxidoreductase
MRVAINGIGVAGPTLAYWLRRYGDEPVLFERAPVLRTGGYIIDFWGLGYEIAEKMGLIAELAARSYHMQELRIVDEHGSRVAGLTLEALRAVADGRFLSVPRGDIAATIFRACGDVEARFGVSIVGIRQDGHRANVELSDGTSEAFDLVIGADGVHSRVRELAFVPESTCEQPLGCHVAAFRLRGYPHRDDLAYVSHTVPKRQAARISLRDDRTLVLLVFRDDLLETRPTSDPEQRAALKAVFGDMGWEVPEILRRMEDAEEIYFDRVSQVHLERWTHGRVALLGDAAACASLLAGEGTGLAMIEAYVLAGELHRAGGDHARAFAAYEALLRPFLARKQRAALSLLSFFAPRTGLALKLRDCAIKVASFPLLTKAFIGRTLRDALVLPTYGPS